MKKKKILHICLLDKFIPPFIDFIKANFEFEQHTFLLIGDINKFPVQLGNNVIHIKQKSQLFMLLREMSRARKIVLHSIFLPQLVKLLAVQPWLLKKCYWVMWGGDLYHYQSRTRSIKENLYEAIRAFVIKRIGYLVNGTTGDIELARMWYGAKGKHIRCFNYPSNIYNNYKIKEKKHSTINIQIGNSADPANQHFEVLKKLEKYKHEDIKLYAPLSYGDKSYAESVICKGKESFGDKFEALTKFMPFSDYLDFLAMIDISVFNHKRQQAFGNAITLLGLGKKVYINSGSTLNGVFKEFDIKVYDIEDLDIRLLDNQVRLRNIDKVKVAFSEESLVKSLKEWLE